MDRSHMHRLLNSKEKLDLFYEGNLIDEIEVVNKISKYISANYIENYLLDIRDLRKIAFYLKTLLINSSKNSSCLVDYVLEFCLKQYDKDDDRSDIINDIFLIILLLNDDLNHISNIFMKIKRLILISELRDVNIILQQLKLLGLLIDILYEKEIAFSDREFGIDLLNGLYKLLQFDIQELQPQVITCFKRIIAYTKSKDLLQMMWNKVQEFFFCETKEMYCFSLICSLADYYINSLNNTNICYDLTVQEKYWMMLQYGIVSNDSLIRKEALYLLKRSIDAIVITKSDIVVPISEKDGNIFFWDNKQSAQLERTWMNMFIILDTLEEKQSHLILPVLNLFTTLKCLHKDWTYRILELIIRHENNSVMKWGVMYILENVKLNSNDLEDRKLLKSFLKSLNNTFLYQDCGIRLLPNMIQFVSHVRNNVLMEINSVSWAPVSLFYLTRAILLSEQPLQNTQNLDLHLIIKPLLRSTIVTQNVYIRSAIKINILNLCIKHYSQTKNSAVTIDLPKILGEFDEKESFKRGTEIWDEVVKLFECLYGSDLNLEIFRTILNNKQDYETGDIATFLTLLIDAEVVRKDIVESELKNALSYFDDCDSRLYASLSTQFFSLDLLINLLKKISTSTNKKNLNNTRHIILSVILISAQKFASYIKLKLFTVAEYNDLHIIEKCMQCLKLFTNEITLFSIILPQLETTILYSSSDILKSNNVMQIFFGVQLLEFLQHYYSTQKALNVHSNLVTNIFVSYNKLGNIFETRRKQDGVTTDQLILCGKIASLYHESLSNIRAVYVRNIETHTDCNINELLNSARESLEVGSRETLISVQDMLQCILPYALKYDNCSGITINLVEDCWKRTFQLRRTEIFRGCVAKFVDMIFQPGVTHFLEIKPLLKFYACEILNQGKSIRGLANILLESVHKTKIYFDGLVDVIVEGLLFGSLNRKDQRIENETCLYISDILPEVINFVKHDVTADLEVRVLSVSIVLNLLKYENELNDHQTHIVNTLTNALLNRSYQECKNKIRYYADSQHHRFKQRLLQSLLILQPYWDEELSKKILEWLVGELILQTQQPSVRYMQEWLIARIIKSSKNIADVIYEIANKISEGRPGAISSPIIITYLLAKYILRNDLENCDEFIEQSINIALPWTMGQNFTARLYAQLTIKKLLDLGYSRDTFNQKFKFLSKSIEQVLSIGNAAKNAKKLLKDIFLNDFDICGHYSIETIFYDLPRVTNYVDEDLISPDIYERKCMFNDFKSIYLRNKDNVMVEAEPILAGAKTLQPDSGDDYVESVDADNSAELTHYNVQKKIVPWQRMDVGDISLSASESFIQKKEEFKSGLVVVASLVGRAPNLGGLARTCEVFGVQEYVIESLKYVEEKQFQSLSVSAEKWINITEVKPWQLPQYIETMRLSGFCIVGAEQTTESRQISETCFPKKTVLILGNEKEGIPANLLPLLDFCVEIPQKGVVRSLNVHVTGALFIWEYIKQNMILKS